MEIQTNNQLDTTSAIKTPYSPHGYAEEINKLVKSVLVSWLQTAQLLAKAKDALSDEEFEEMQALVQLSKSSIYKLVKVGQCQWIAEQQNKLSHVESWGTLHQIALLDETGRQQLMDQYLSVDPPLQITRSDVSQIRGKAKPPAVAAPNNTVAKINLDADATLTEAGKVDLGVALNLLMDIEGIKVTVNDSLPLSGEMGFDNPNTSSESHGFGHE